jgi:hypothetical protein
MSVTIGGIEFDHNGAVIGMMLVNVRLLLERDGELKITRAEAHISREQLAPAPAAAA